MNLHLRQKRTLKRRLSPIWKKKAFETSLDEENPEVEPVEIKPAMTSPETVGTEDRKKAEYRKKLEERKKAAESRA